MYEIELSVLRENLKGKLPFKFSFVKSDGKSRDAIGTLNEGLIPTEFAPKDASTHFNGSNFKYFDLEKNAWRSLNQNVKTVTISE